MSFFSSLGYVCLYFLLFIGVVYVIIRSDILSYFEWYRKLTSRANMTKILMSSAMSMMKDMQQRSAAADNARNTKIDVDRDAGVVTIPIVDERGNIYMHRVPYSNTTMMRTRSVDVYLDMEDGQQIKVTQLPGTAYSYTAAELGGIGYTITYQNHIIKNISSNEHIMNEMLCSIREEANDNNDVNDDGDVVVEEEVDFN